ncbi:MAG TPA: hypothetical protein VF590_04445, partial [Isosphaeraceae bacterium]
MLDIPVTDDKLGPVGTVASLAPGASQTLYKYGTATGTVTGKTPRNVAVSAFDPSGDFCAKPSLSINRLTNGEDGATIPAGTPLTWTDQVTNTGNVTRASIVVMDDNGTPLDTSDDITVGTINSLDPGKSLALGDFGFALLGSYSNLGTASSSYTDGLGNTKRVSATDPSSYIGQRV